MNFHTQTEQTSSIDADWIVLGVLEGGKPALADHASELLAMRIAGFAEGKDFDGKPNELLALHGPFEGIKAKRVMLVGLGKPDQVTKMRISRAAATATRAIAGKQRSKVAFTLFGSGTNNVAVGDAAAALVTGVSIGMVGADLYKTEKNRYAIGDISVACTREQNADVEKAVSRGTILGDAVNLAHDLVNQPPADIYPETFCERALAVAKPAGVACEIFDADQLAKNNMNCILAVGKGSERPPRLLILRYTGPAAAKDKTLCFVGKGMTFDSGGLCIKTADGMVDMKCDMAGAATVLAAVTAIAKLKLPINIIGLCPLAENMTGSKAYRPGDVLRAKNGKTIEVLNTDAEGRLILADALSHAVDLKATHIVDLATLTGACVVALGTQVAGLMTNNQPWCQQVLDAAGRAGERAWQLPMFEEYDELIKSSIADMKNIGGKWGGAITAAKLLVQFVGDIPWTHIDIAGPAFGEKDYPYQDAGGTGAFVRTLVELAEELKS